MTRERIEDIREIVLPFVRKRLKEINYENLGESDAKEFENDFNEILNLAIKALEVVAEQELCEDCISRAAAMTEMQMNARRYSLAKEFGGMGQVEWSDFLISIKDALNILRDLPSVQPKTDIRECGSCKHSKDGHMAGTEECHECMWESKQEPKTGHWIDGHCSECGCDVPAYIIDWKWQKDMNAKYCPNCGARMIEVSE